MHDAASASCSFVPLVDARIRGVGQQAATQPALNPTAGNPPMVKSHTGYREATKMQYLSRY